MLEHFSERKLDEKYEGLKEKLLNDIELEINAVSGNIKNRKNT